MGTPYSTAGDRGLNLLIVTSDGSRSLRVDDADLRPG
jgi:hypothetical protein